MLLWWSVTWVENTIDMSQVTETLFIYIISSKHHDQIEIKVRRGRDRMVVGFITTYAIGAYHL